MDETITEVVLDKIYELDHSFSTKSLGEGLEYILEPILAELEELRRLCDEYVR